MKRVFHPTLNSWQDVPDGDVDKWVKAGWRKTQPQHVTGDLPEVGSHPGIAAVPVLEDTSTTVTATGTSTGSGTTAASTR